jgi:predicted O-methyltransferase YrrM
MSQATWESVEHYLAEHVVKPDAVFDVVRESSKAAGLPDIAVSAAEGKQLYLMARMIGAKAILEIGTLGGYSTIWLARALPPGGKVVTLEYNPKHAEVARANIARAGLAGKVEVKTGAGLELLPTLAGPFDFFFIDANKDGYPEYFRWAVKLSRPGSVMVFDNVVRDGKVIDAESTDVLVQGVRALHNAIAAEPRVTATAIQTVGSKGYDGYVVAVVNGPP